MIRLPQTTLHFNRQLKLSNDGGELSSDTGCVVSKSKISVLYCRKWWTRSSISRSYDLVVYISNGVVDFMRPLIEHYNEIFPETSTLVLGDSGFAVPALYDLCEKEFLYYIIRLKSNAKLKALAEDLHPTHGVLDVSMTESYVEDSIYQASSWTMPRRIIIQSTRPADELSFIHAFFLQISEKVSRHKPLLQRTKSEVRWKFSLNKRRMDWALIKWKAMISAWTKHECLWVYSLTI